MSSPIVYQVVVLHPNACTRHLHSGSRVSSQAISHVVVSRFNLLSINYLDLPSIVAHCRSIHEYGLVCVVKRCGFSNYRYFFEYRVSND